MAALMSTVVGPVALSSKRTSSDARKVVPVPAVTSFQFPSVVFQLPLAAPVQKGLSPETARVMAEPESPQVPDCRAERLLATLVKLFPPEPPRVV